jgi:ketosteroid isomerase-like protein
LPLAVALPLLAVGLVAGSNLDRPNRVEAQPQFNQMISAQEEAEFRRLLVDYYAAWSIPTNKSWTITKAEKFYQRTDRLFGFDFNPPATGFQGWQVYKRELTTIMSNYSTFTAALGDRFVVYRNGNVVWPISTFNITGTLKDGSPISGSGRNTLIWERVGNQWLIAHEHVSTPLIPQPK